jgi:hypothetical protein
MTQPHATTRDVIVRTDRFEEAVRFYQTTMGFAVTLRREGLVGFETGAFQLFVERGPGHGPVFEVKATSSHVDAREHLISAGCAVVEEDAAVPRCYMRDPFGLVFNLER